MDKGDSHMTENGATATQSPNARAEKLAYDLEGWRELIIRFEGVLNWEQPRVLGGVIGVTTFIFFILWYWDTPLLTSVAFLGLLAALADYGVPLLASRLFQGGSQWSGTQERQFLAICRRLVNAQDHVSKFFNWLVSLRRERPASYFAAVVPALFVLAFVGGKFNNLCLTYFLIIFLLMLPGLRHRGIIQEAFSVLLAKIKAVTGSKTKAKAKEK